MSGVTYVTPRQSEKVRNLSNDRQTICQTIVRQIFNNIRYCELYEQRDGSSLQ